MAFKINPQNQKYPTKVWESLSKRCLPSRDPDADYWWQLTGYHLANMVDAAGYSVDRQYEALLFHWHWVVPRLGSAPASDGSVKWKSLTGIEGSPMEYSWRWNTSKGEPDIRYSWEPINQLSGTALDPLGHSASLEYMHQVPAVVPDVDFTWAHHFLDLLFDHNIDKYVKEDGLGPDKPTTTFLTAVEYVRGGPSLKSYFIPRKPGQKTAFTLEQWDEAIVKLDPNHPGRDTMMEFLRHNSEGQLFRPVILGIDDVTPSESRLKLYFTTPHTSFASVREIMTLGGLIKVPESDMQDLRSFILTTLGLPDDYPEAAEISINKQWARPEKDLFIENESMVAGFVYFFDIAPGSNNAIPKMKFYNPVRKYGPDDRGIAENLMSWMKARGRGVYAAGYLRMLESVAEHRGLENGKGLHTYISYMFSKKGEPDVKSYICPEAYHPARFVA